MLKNILRLGFLVAVFGLVLLGCGDPAPTNDWKQAETNRPAGVITEEDGSK